MAAASAFPPPPGVAEGFQTAGIGCCAPFRFLLGRFPSPKFPSVLQGWELHGLAVAAPRQGLSSPLS